MTTPPVSILDNKPIPASAAQRIGRLEAVFQKIFTRSARVLAIDDVGTKFKLITLGSDDLKQVIWTPGDKIHLQFGGWVHRTYTPINWDSNQGHTQILVYLHGDGPGANWVRHLHSGDDCTLFGPRSSIDLSKLQPTAFIFGDETSLGLVAALSHIKPALTSVQIALETSLPDELLDVIEALGLSHADIYIHTRHPNDAHFCAVQNQAIALLRTQPLASFVLTGQAHSIQRLGQCLRRQGVRASQLLNTAYWAAGKSGLD